jgi:hypothetical protein
MQEPINSGPEFLIGGRVELRMPNPTPLGRELALFALSAVAGRGRDFPAANVAFDLVHQVWFGFNGLAEVDGVARPYRAMTRTPYTTHFSPRPKSGAD